MIGSSSFFFFYKNLNCRKSIEIRVLLDQQ